MNSRKQHGDVSYDQSSTVFASVQPRIDPIWGAVKQLDAEMHKDIKIQ